LNEEISTYMNEAFNYGEDSRIKNQMDHNGKLKASKVYEMSLYALFKYYSKKEVKYPKSSKKIIADFSFDNIL
jgi:hypothetical protein